MWWFRHEACFFATQAAGFDSRGVGFPGILVLRELREIRIYIVLTATVAFCLRAGLDYYWHWTAFTRNVSYLLSLLFGR